MPRTLTLESGRRLGPYEIRAPLGAGGMGEVYRASDTRLGRDIALKLLPSAVASDPERLARLEREAKVLASLSHPGIAVLHSLEEARVEDGAPVLFLTMELAPGEDLAERLARGALPVDEAVAVARQVAEALEAAHETGIVHRDLKPANVKLSPDGQVKVLDFGLAKAWSGDPGAPGASSAELSQSPTLANTGTAAGLILGTAAYMSPEQARGKPVDKRADIWAFGALLYEMLTGQKLFQGETVSDVLAAVLTREPGWGELPAATPPRVRRLLSRCLERDSKLRLRDIGEARIALASSDLADASAAEAPPRTPASRLLRALPWALALALGLGLLADRLTPRDEAPARDTIRFSFDAQDALRPTAQVSPDGRLVAFNQGTAARGAASARNLIFLRPLGGLEAKPLAPGNLGGWLFFWSPDSRELAVGVDATGVVAVDTATGAQRTICEFARGAPRGGAWSPDGVVLLSFGGTIFRVPATGGTLAPLVEPQQERFSWHGYPRFLPDGRRFAFTSEMREGGENVPVVQIAELAAPAEARVVVKRAMLAGVTHDRILYGTPSGDLLVVGIDPASLATRGVPQLVAQQMNYDTRAGFVAASISTNGVLAYRRGQDPQSEFVWLDRAGRRLGRLGEPGPWHNFDLSADGAKVIAATRRSGASSTLWLIDTTRGVTSAALESADSASDPTWSPDGARIAYRMRGTLVTRAAQGGAETVVLNEAGYPDSWSRDGRFLTYGAPRLGHYDLFAIEVEKKDAVPVLLATGAPQADETRFSPDGRWIAYNAATGSVDQVHVIPFPPTGERWQISGDGGVQPRWSPSGDELFYLDRAGRLMSVAMPGSDPRRAGVPQPLFETRLTPSNIFDQFAVAARDRFLLRLPYGDDPGVPVNVIVGWDR